MTYDELDINQKLNLKEALREWATYAVAHFKEDLNKKVYGLRSTKKGRSGVPVQRSSLGASYRFGSGRSRTNNLRRTWYQNVQDGAGVDRVMIQFLQYGRYVEMGVGRGVTHTDRLVARQLRLGKTSRTKKAWYSKRKTYETHRLREVLAERHIQIAVDTIESALNLSATLNL